MALAAAAAMQRITGYGISREEEENPNSFGAVVRVKMGNFLHFVADEFCADAKMQEQLRGHTAKLPHTNLDLIVLALLNFGEVLEFARADLFALPYAREQFEALLGAALANVEPETHGAASCPKFDDPAVRDKLVRYAALMREIVAVCPPRDFILPFLGARSATLLQRWSAEPRVYLSFATPPIPSAEEALGGFERVD